MDSWLAGWLTQHLAHPTSPPAVKRKESDTIAAMDRGSRAAERTDGAGRAGMVKGSLAEPKRRERVNRSMRVRQFDDTYDGRESATRTDGGAITYSFDH